MSKKGAVEFEVIWGMRKHFRNIHQDSNITLNFGGETEVFAPNHTVLLFLIKQAAILGGNIAVCAKQSVP